jgi:hypothetical protein
MGTWKRRRLSTVLERVDICAAEEVENASNVESVTKVLAPTGVSK